MTGGASGPAADLDGIVSLNGITEAGVDTPAEFDVRDYIRIARPDHWIKNVFMLPGVAVALVVAPNIGGSIARSAALALFTVCLVASANYTINDLFEGMSRPLLKM
jgi:hypothetical protein